MLSHNGIPRVKMNALVCLSFFYHIVKLVKHIEFFLSHCHVLIVCSLLQKNKLRGLVKSDGKSS